MCVSNFEVFRVTQCIVSLLVQGGVLQVLMVLVFCMRSGFWTLSKDSLDKWLYYAVFQAQFIFFCSFLFFPSYPNDKYDAWKHGLVKRLGIPAQAVRHFYHLRVFEFLRLILVSSLPSSRFTDSKKYEDDFVDCFNLKERRSGEICNACVLLVKRWKKLPKGTDRNWHHVSVNYLVATLGQHCQRFSLLANGSYDNRIIHRIYTYSYCV